MKASTRKRQRNEEQSRGFESSVTRAVNASPNPTVIELFAGAGGSTLGIKQAGFEVRAAVEIDPTKAATLVRNHPHLRVLGHGGSNGDVRLISGDNLASFARLDGSRLDTLVACPPCQGYSLRGKKDATDPRNSLYLDFLRLTEELHPLSVVFENVPGMALLYDGRFLTDLLKRLEKIGYATAVWHLRASDLGVPQIRERIFVIGTLGREPGKPPRNRRAVGVWEAIADLPVMSPRPRGAKSKEAPYRGPPRSSYAAKLRGKRSSVTGCERTRHSPRLVDRFRGLRWERTDSSTWHRRLHPQKPASTLTAGTRTLTACRPVHPFAHRVLTVREAARLASFPDWYAFPDHTAEAWSQIGNSVPPVMARAVFMRLRAFLLSVREA